MVSLTVDISEEAHEKLCELVQSEHESAGTVLDRALEAYRRHIFLKQANAEFEALKANPEAWQEELEERALWDSTLHDGLEEE